VSFPQIHNRSFAVWYPADAPERDALRDFPPAASEGAPPREGGCCRLLFRAPEELRQRTPLRPYSSPMPRAL